MHLILAKTSVLRYGAMAFGRRHACCYNRSHTAPRPPTGAISCKTRGCRYNREKPASEFALPAANRAGVVSLADLRGRAFLIGFYRGLHCPFCRRQVVQLGAVQPVLSAAGIETLAVINTPVERARLYFRHRPTPVTLLSDPDCLTHRAYGVPQRRVPARRQPGEA